MSTEVKDKGEMVAKLFTRLEEIKESIPGEVKEANQEVRNNLDKLSDDLIAQDKQVKALEAALVSKQSFNDGVAKNNPEDLKKFHQFFKNFGSNPESLEIKAMRTDSNPQGGYLVLPEYDTQIGKILFDSSPISRLATRKTVQGNRYVKFVRDNLPRESKYRQELESTDNKSTATYKEVQVSTHSLYGKFPISDEMLLDASFNAEAELMEAINEDLSLDMERDLVSGNGVKTARGLFTYPDAGYTAGERTYGFGQIERVPSGSTTAIASVDNILNLYFALKPRYVQNATWLMKSFTHRDILKLKSTSNYHFLGFQPSDRNQVPTLAIMGRPIEYAEDMDANGTENNVIIGFGDIAKTYTIVEKPGITILRDIYSGDGQVIFKVTKRFGGGITNFDSFKVMDNAAS